MKMSWDDYHLLTLRSIPSRSLDPSTACGAIIVSEDNSIVSTGYNDFPRKVQELPERRERPAKYLYTEHAERNAIYNAARHGIRTKGCTLYVTHHPCADCARAIIQSGIRRVVIDDGELLPTWEESVSAAMEMLTEAGIEVVKRGTDV